MILGMPVYEGVDLLDVAGPYEMFSWVDADLGLKPTLLSIDGGPVTTINGFKFDVHARFSDHPTFDVLWVPGGDPASLRTMMSDPDSPYLAYLNQVAATATWVCSVCEGALLLAKAGLLDGHEATTHWAFVECLEQFKPAVTVDQHHRRYVVSGNRLTGGGISSGLDESLKLISLLFGDAVAEDVQVSTQYFPEPPVMGQIPARTPKCMFSW